MTVATAALCQACSIEMHGDDQRELAGLVFEGGNEIGFTAHVSCRACGPTLVNSEGLCMFTCLKNGMPGHGGRALTEPVVVVARIEEDDEDDLDDDFDEDDEYEDDDLDVDDELDDEEDDDEK